MKQTQLINLAISDVPQKNYPKSPFPKRALPLLAQSKSITLPTNTGDEDVDVEPQNHIDHTYNTSLSSSQSFQHTFNSSYSSITLSHNHNHTYNTSISHSNNDHQKHTSTLIRNYFSRKHSKSENKQSEINTNIPKSKWHPTLQFILNDDQLLAALIIFMKKQYNQENILFLKSVNGLKANIDRLLSLNKKPNTIQNDNINSQIISIYNTYIKQLNLSSECFNNIIYMYQKFRSLSLLKKQQMFDRSVFEINSLITKSILPNFFTSEEFQVIAFSRNIFDNEKHDSNSNDLHNAKFFDSHCTQHWNDKNKFIMSSKGFSDGRHQWSIKILKCNELRQEFGVISHFDATIPVNEFGICNTTLFGARSVYGYNHLHGAFYYASYNKDNTVRCEKDLSNLAVHKHYQWQKNDVIKIRINCKKGKIKYYLNGKQVRKTISLEKDTTYYPIILYSGHCVYRVVDDTEK